MKKLKFAAIVSPLVLVAPIALASCGTDSGNTKPGTTYETQDDFNNTFRSKTFANLTADNRYSALGADYYDILTRVYNGSEDGMIPGLTIAENFYNDSTFNGGVSKPWWDNKILSTLVDTSVDADDGQKQSLQFDDKFDWTQYYDASSDTSLKEVHAFKSWKVNKKDFLDNITVTDKIHSEIKKVVDGDKVNNYMLYVPKNPEKIGSDEVYNIYLFRKIKTSQRIFDAWEFFKKNFAVSQDVLMEEHATYTLAPTQRYEAIDKEVLTWVTDSATGAKSSHSSWKFDEFAAPMHGDFQTQLDKADRSHGSNLKSNFAIKYTGDDAKWVSEAMPALKGFTFNLTWARNENTFDEQLKVTIIENDDSKTWTSNAETTKAVKNMATFIFDGSDIMRFAETSKPLYIWTDLSGPQAGKTDHQFVFDSTKLHQLINSDSFSYDGLTNILAKLTSSADGFATLNIFEAKTEIADLFAVLAVTNNNHFNLKERATFDKFCTWVNAKYPNFSFKTLQFVLEQLDGRQFPALMDISPLIHFELQFTSQLYKMMIDFFNDPANASLVPTAQSTQP